MSDSGDRLTGVSYDNESVTMELAGKGAAMLAHSFAPVLAQSDETGRVEFSFDYDEMEIEVVVQRRGNKDPQRQVVMYQLLLKDIAKRLDAGEDPAKIAAMMRRARPKS